MTSNSINIHKLVKSVSYVNLRMDIDFQATYFPQLSLKILECHCVPGVMTKLRVEFRGRVIKSLLRLYYLLIFLN